MALSTYLRIFNSEAINTIQSCGGGGSTGHRGQEDAIFRALAGRFRTFYFLRRPDKLYHRQQWHYLAGNLWVQKIT